MLLVHIVENEFVILTQFSQKEVHFFELCKYIEPTWQFLNHVNSSHAQNLFMTGTAEGK